MKEKVLAILFSKRNVADAIKCLWETSPTLEEALLGIFMLGNVYWIIEEAIERRKKDEGHHDRA